MFIPMVSPLLLISRRIFLKLFLVGIVSPKEQWGYTGTVDASHWAELSEEYHTCGDGQRQSPIDIDGTTAIDAPVRFNYRPIPIDLLNNGRTIQETGDKRCTLTLNKQVYTLIQFHFHTPSEHTNGGTSYPMELHLVHRHPATQALAVVGVWLIPGKEQPELAMLSKYLPKQTGDHINDASVINPENLLPINRALVKYDGSLTTPPCSEGVTWLMMVNPIEASPQQIDTFHQLLGNNSRPLQR